MSPSERIDSWEVRPASDASESVAGNKKRKRAYTPSTRAGRQHKLQKMEDDEMDHTPDLDYDGDTQMDDDEEDELASGMSTIRVGHSPSLREEYEDEDLDIEETIVVSEAEYARTTPKRKRIIDLPKEHESRGVSTEELRAHGWDDDHITLVQHIAMRGFEPLLPKHWKFDYRFMPDALFEQDDDAFISSVRGDHYRGVMALEKLFELGARTRDRVLLDGRVTPEEQVRRQLTAYMKWAEADAGLDTRTAIPLITLEMKPSGTPAAELQENARCKLARLAARYTEAFRVRQSIENSPTTDSTSTKLSYPVPTLYAFIASHTVVALAAYRHDDPERKVKPVAFFDMKDKDHDVWNALALAIVVCHARNVQVRIAEETGVGVKQHDAPREEPEDDPDA